MEGLSSAAAGLAIDLTYFMSKYFHLHIHLELIYRGTENHKAKSPRLRKIVSGFENIFPCNPADYKQSDILKSTLRIGLGWGHSLSQQGIWVWFGCPNS